MLIETERLREPEMESLREKLRERETATEKNRLERARESER